MLDFKFASIFPVFTPNLDPRIPENYVFSIRKMFFEKRPLEVNSDCGSFLDANMFPKSTQNPRTSGKKSSKSLGK